MTKRRRLQIKSEAVAYLGAVCAGCGWRGDVRGYDFHHKDPSTKLFEIAQCYVNSVDLIKAELDKCELLCARCHRLVSARDPLWEVELARLGLTLDYAGN